MSVRQSTLTAGPQEEYMLDTLGPHQTHPTQRSSPDSDPHNSGSSSSHHNSATGASWDERGHPAVVKITLYRLLNTMIILGVGTVKFALGMQGHSISPTILDWVLGSLYLVVIYWIGFLEDVRPPVWPWFFSEDYVTPLARKLFSMVVESLRHRWESMKRNPKRDLFAFLLGQLGGLLSFLIPKLLLSIFHLGIIGVLFAVLTWGTIAWLVADLVFPDSPEV